MRYSLGLLSAAVVFTAFVAAPAHIHGQAPAAQAQEPHDQQAADAKLNALVQTMNAKEHGAMHNSMMNMMGMMGMMNNMPAGMGKAPDKAKP